MKNAIWVLSIALCACTSPQYAQFSQRVNKSITKTMGRQTEPSPPSQWKSETAVDYVQSPEPSDRERADAAYARHIVGMGPVPKVTFVPTPSPKQPTAKGLDLVDGAIVCPSFDEVSWLYGQINSARHARQSLSPELRKNGALLNGYDYGAEPRPVDYRCQFVPAGTPMNVRMEMGAIPIVWGKLQDGRPFAGVTIPNMIDR